MPPIILCCLVIGGKIVSWVCLCNYMHTILDTLDAMVGTHSVNDSSLIVNHGIMSTYLALEEGQ